MFLNFFAFSGMLQIFQSLGSHVATATTITFNWDLISFIPLLGIPLAAFLVVDLVWALIRARRPATSNVRISSKNPEISTESAHSAVRES